MFDGRENYAVIVGVDRYDIASPYYYAAADANRLADFFRALERNLMSVFGDN